MLSVVAVIVFVAIVFVVLVETAHAGLTEIALPIVALALAAAVLLLLPSLVALSFLRNAARGLHVRVKLGRKRVRLGAAVVVARSSAAALVALAVRCGGRGERGRHRTEAHGLLALRGAHARERLVQLRLRRRELRLLRRDRGGLAVVKR